MAVLSEAINEEVKYFGVQLVDPVSTTAYEYCRSGLTFLGVQRENLTGQNDHYSNGHCVIGG